jgi:hypothetical protein
VNDSKLRVACLVTVALLCVATGTASAQSVVQGPVFNAANGHTYYRLSNSNWSAAEAFSASLGGHLVSINDAAENAFVLENFANAPGSGRVWLGLNDAASEGNFVWANGDLLTYSNWEPGEPNNSGNEDYVAMYPGNGRWVDLKNLANPPGIGNVCGVVEMPKSVEVEEKSWGAIKRQYQ